MLTNQKLVVQSSAAQASQDRSLVLPNPGDVIIAMVFGWSFFCFFLVIGGKQILRQLARLSRSESMQELFLSADVQALGL
jgi:hypothetical protein